MNTSDSDSANQCPGKDTLIEVPFDSVMYEITVAYPRPLKIQGREWTVPKPNVATSDRVI